MDKAIVTAVAIGVTFGAAVGVALGLRATAVRVATPDPAADPAGGAASGGAVDATGDISGVPGAGDGIGVDVVAATDAAASDTAAGLGGFRFDEVRLIDQTGQPLDETVLDGRFTAVTFFFTSCQGPCPALTATMRRVQDGTAGSALRLLSVSVDGDNDTPGVIRGYGEANGADFSRWTFATGAPETVAAVAQAALSFTVQADGQTVTGPRGNEVPNIIHPTRILLVGPDRRVAAVYAYNDPGQIEALIGRFAG